MILQRWLANKFAPTAARSAKADFADNFMLHVAAVSTAMQPTHIKQCHHPTG